eukprot:Awhi_evm1s2960
MKTTTTTTFLSLALPFDVTRLDSATTIQLFDENTFETYNLDTTKSVDKTFQSSTEFSNSFSVEAGIEVKAGAFKGSVTSRIDEGTQKKDAYYWARMEEHIYQKSISMSHSSVVTKLTEQVTQALNLLLEQHKDYVDETSSDTLVLGGTSVERAALRNLLIGLDDKEIQTQLTEYRNNWLTSLDNKAVAVGYELSPLPDALPSHLYSSLKPALIAGVSMVLGEQISNQLAKQEAILSSLYQSSCRKGMIYDVYPASCDAKLTTKKCKPECKTGYERIDKDLNRQSTTPWSIMLCFSRNPKDSPTGKPIEALEVVYKKSTNCPADYDAIEENLNKGAIGTSSYLCVKRIKDMTQGTKAITDVDILYNKDSTLPTWTKIKKDLNKGNTAFSSYVYVAYRGVCDSTVITNEKK